ncbi:hypothetical protein Tco_1506557 [Tanacetum coccineum]
MFSRKELFHHESLRNVVGFVIPRKRTKEEEGMKNLNENDCSNSFEVPDTVFENEGGSKKDSSVDPFGLYHLLNKKTKDKKHKESGDKKSVNDFEEEKLNEDDGDSNNSNLKENVDESASFGRFKKSVAPRSEEFILDGVLSLGVIRASHWTDSLSDHRTILPSRVGPMIMVRFLRFFHHWIHSRAFDFVTSTWNSCPSVEDSNGYAFSIANLKKELNQLDAVIDKGSVLRQIKWSIEGDENSNFFHGILNKKRNQMNIRGITIDGVWKEQPNDVKQEFLSHFQDRFAKPSERRANIDMRFPKTISEGSMSLKGPRAR